MNAKISVFVICIKAIIYLLLYDLHGCTFNSFDIITNTNAPNAYIEYVLFTKRFGKPFFQSIH